MECEKMFDAIVRDMEEEVWIVLERTREDLPEDKIFEGMKYIQSDEDYSAIRLPSARLRGMRDKYIDMCKY